MPLSSIKFSLAREIHTIRQCKSLMSEFSITICYLLYQIFRRRQDLVLPWSQNHPRYSCLCHGTTKLSWISEKNKTEVLCIYPKKTPKPNKQTNKNTAKKKPTKTNPPQTNKSKTNQTKNPNKEKATNSKPPYFVLCPFIIFYYVKHIL